jgi:AmmeMemoRadiSam system protein B
VPHAGLMFSGMVAAHFYARLAEDGFPKTFVIIGPNHSGSGSGIALLRDDFETPMGVAKVDRELASQICDGLVQDDPVAHYFEHSIEIQLPFIQYFTDEFTFVPISMSFQDFENASDLGETIRRTTAGRDVVVIASSDMSHYVPPSVAKEKDGLALDRIRAMDARGLYDVVVEEDISMCGYGPTVAVMTACAGGKAQVLRYGTSGDVRPMNEVVGYASVVIEK